MIGTILQKYGNMIPIRRLTCKGRYGTANNTVKWSYREYLQQKYRNTFRCLSYAFFIDFCEKENFFLPCNLITSYSPQSYGMCLKYMWES